ncbi:MAG: hypothetical protein EBS81_12455, partial [Gammaproteobacteria bacterium]|nr:hypothetical protein [Gammaproteobacteria bacterium]
MTTLLELPQGFNPAFAPQPMTQGPNTAFAPQTIQGGAPPPNRMLTGAQVQQMSPRMASQNTGGETLTDWATGKVPTTTNPDGSWKGFGDFFGGLGDWLSGNAGAITGIGSIAGALNNANDTRQLGVGIQAYLDSLGSQLNTGSQFQGYGVTTGLGTSSAGYDPETGKLITDLGMADKYADYNWGEAG